MIFAATSPYWSACTVDCIARSAAATSPPWALDPALREMGVESLAVVNTPTERARLYFRYHPMPTLLAPSDPERTSHRAFGLPEISNSPRTRRNGHAR